jgi:hypothetical protein
MTRISLAICLLAVAVTPIDAVGADTELKKRSDALMFAYTDCATDWVGENITSGASASELAEAAHAACLHKFQLYQDASVKYFESFAPNDPSSKGREKGLSVANDVREMTRGHVMRLIIETRADTK